MVTVVAVGVGVCPHIAHTLGLGVAISVRDAGGLASEGLGVTEVVILTVCITLAAADMFSKAVGLGVFAVRIIGAS